MEGLFVFWLILNSGFGMFETDQIGGVTLGAKILTTTLFSLLMVGGVDIFSEWYRIFLQKRGVDPKLIRFLRRLTFVILAFLFWRSLISQEVLFEFSSTHFFFALFIYSCYRLIASFYRDRSERS